jgi:hypothetical protein
VYDSTGPIYGKGGKNRKNGKSEKMGKSGKIGKSVPHRVYRIGHPSHLISQAIFPDIQATFPPVIKIWTAFFQFFPFFQVYDIGGG